METVRTLETVPLAWLFPETCTDVQLQAIVRSTSKTGKFAQMREAALVEMGRRVAAASMSRAEARRRERAIRSIFDR